MAIRKIRFAPGFGELLLEEFIEGRQVVHPPVLPGAHFAEVPAELNEACIALLLGPLFPGQDLIDLRQHECRAAMIVFAVAQPIQNKIGEIKG
jgi:hypothetical protein